MNTFSGLKPEEGENTEITDPKGCKRAEKKLRQKRERLKNCDCEKTKEKLSLEIRIIEIEIEEYENRDKGIPAKKEKPKPKPKAKEYEFDEDEILKYNAKRKRENEEEAEKEREERQKRKEESREHWKKWEQRSKSWDNEENKRKKSKGNYKWIPDENEDDNKGPVDLKSFIEEFNMKLKDVPKDIMNLNHKFTIEDFKQLSRKYHPDKLSGKQDYMYILNEIRDHYIKRDVKHDETWTK